MSKIMCNEFMKWGLSRVTNRDWLNKMALIDMLNIISQRFDGCFVYRIAENNFDEINGRCNKYNNNCYDCIAAWLNEDV